MDGAIKLLRSCLVSDELSSDEQLILCLQILHGAASITGTSGTESYGVVYRDDIDTRPSDLSNISQMVTDMTKENDQLRKENQALSSKFAFLAGRLKNYELRQVNEAYYAETGNPMFPDIVIPPWSRKDPDMGSMLESFLAQQRQRAGRSRIRLAGTRRYMAPGHVGPPRRMGTGLVKRAYAV